MIDPVGLSGAPEPSTTSATIHGVRITSRVMHATGSAVGGDWCEAFEVEDGIIAFSIGDVCGHGEEKFGTMRAVRQAIRDAAYQGNTPARTLAIANRFLRRHDPAEYATALFGLYSPRTSRFAFANAGHPPPLLTWSLESCYLDYAEHDLPLGILDELALEARSVTVPPAALLVLYSDGVTEHERLPLHGAMQLRSAALIAFNLATLPTAAVIEEQMGFAPHRADDIAILAAWTPRGARAMRDGSR